MDKIVLLGKLPPPYYGPAIATEIILNSALIKEFDLVHIDTRLNTTMRTMGKFGLSKVLKTMGIYLRYSKALGKPGVKLVVIPIAQKTGALLKDSIFVLLAKLFGKRVLLQLRGSALLDWYNEQNGLTRNFFRRIFRICSGAIVLGNKLKYIFEPFFPHEKIFVVPNGGNFDFVKNTDKKAKTSLLYLANLQESKGIGDVLLALGILPEEIKKKIVFDVAGTWRNNDFKAQCIDQINKYKLPVNFHGTLSGDPKKQIFSNAGIFIFTPKAPEGHPWVIVEAMAAGLAIISTDQGAITESVIHGVNGFIVKSNSPEDIAGKISFLIDNPEDKNRMGKESRRLYEENFTEEKMVKGLATVFRQVLNK